MNVLERAVRDAIEASPSPQGGERDTKSAPGAECSLPSGESGPPVTSGFPGADTAELRLLIEEYRPSNHDWGFRKSVILDVLSRIESRSPAATVSEDDLVASMMDRWVHENDARAEARHILSRFALTDKRPPMQEEGK